MKLKDVNFARVGGLKTACLTRPQLVEVIAATVADYRQQVEAGERPLPVLVFDSNGQGISLANSDPGFMQLLAQADIIHADGQSVVKMSRRFAERPIPERSATTDLIHDIPRLHNRPLRHFLLGGKEQVVNECAWRMQQSYENFAIAGTQHGYFLEEDEQRVIDHINRLKPDVLWIGLGKPKEQAFCIRHKWNLQVPVIITCGGCYNYVTGDYRRAPQFMQEWGLEWLHRALSEPRKFLWRYLTTNPHALYCMYKHRVTRQQPHGGTNGY
ncbi:WecB/TagA/CpsF family glycosyltransferase [Bowmanella dokdonensis]|uniref:WecB/TagA/CpsF family glycosyltransferase n=1 Tax=Bowmanella dokdonensis TaxID=751969 RepID=A0A939ILY2_9ALTE|nr:WecB/TagA/CpsF family glycosyltransferase [Bowmanella dokdonensis]MBN7824698.1 WecB/TagA/CpsF family glycosyltransferase [Bowmanella dokdonensis]